MALLCMIIFLQYFTISFLWVLAPLKKDVKMPFLQLCKILSLVSRIWLGCDNFRGLLHGLYIHTTIHYFLRYTSPANRMVTERAKQALCDNNNAEFPDNVIWSKYIDFEKYFGVLVFLVILTIL